VGGSFAGAPPARELVDDAKPVSAVETAVGDADVGAGAFVDDFDPQPVLAVREAQLDRALAMDEGVVDQFGEDRLCVLERCGRMVPELRLQQSSSVRSTAGLARQGDAEELAAQLSGPRVRQRRGVAQVLGTSQPRLVCLPRLKLERGEPRRVRRGLFRCWLYFGASGGRAVCVATARPVIAADSGESPERPTALATLPVVGHRNRERDSWS
jgi:hypothetical protein